MLGRDTGECRYIFSAEAVLTFVSLARLVLEERCDFFFFFPLRLWAAQLPAQLGVPSRAWFPMRHGSATSHPSWQSVLESNRALKNRVKPTIFHGVCQELGMACGVAGCREW